MDWNLAIRRNRDRLRAIVLALFALAGLRPHRSLPAGPDGRVSFTLPRSIMSMIMLVLRPAESCVRRLILIAALGLGTAALTSPRRGEVPGAAGRRGVIARTPAFKLFDPLKSFDPHSIWDAEPIWESGFDFTDTTQQENPDQHLPVTNLGQRLNALLRAIDTIPAQARRLKRWELRRDALRKADRPTRKSPMRPGLPPGWRERRLHEIDDVLRECHGLAHDRLDSS